LLSKSGEMANSRTGFFWASPIWSGISSVLIDLHNQCKIDSSRFATNLSKFTLTTRGNAAASRASPDFSTRHDHYASWFHFSKPSLILWFVPLIMGWATECLAGFSHIPAYETSGGGKRSINWICTAGVSLFCYCLTRIIARYQYQSRTSTRGKAARSKKLKMHRFAGCRNSIQKYFKWLFREDLQRHFRCLIQKNSEFLTISPHLLPKSILNSVTPYHKQSRERSTRRGYCHDAIDQFFSSRGWVFNVQWLNLIQGEYLPKFLACPFLATNFIHIQYEFG
jgi:hypothetical protein